MLTRVKYLRHMDETSVSALLTLLPSVLCIAVAQSISRHVGHGGSARIGQAPPHRDAEQTLMPEAMVRRFAPAVSSALEPAASQQDERDGALYCLLAAHPGRTIVFANAVSTIRRVAAILQQLGIPAAPLHASMQQRQRLKVGAKHSSCQRMP